MRRELNVVDCDHVTVIIIIGQQIRSLYFIKSFHHRSIPHPPRSTLSPCGLVPCVSPVCTWVLVCIELESIRESAIARTNAAAVGH